MFTMWYESTVHCCLYKCQQLSYFPVLYHIIGRNPGSHQAQCCFQARQDLTSPEIHVLLLVFQEMIIQHRNLFQPLQILKSEISSKPLNCILRVKLISLSCYFQKQRPSTPFNLYHKEKGPSGATPMASVSSQCQTCFCNSVKLPFPVLVLIYPPHISVSDCSGLSPSLSTRPLQSLSSGLKFDKLLSTQSKVLRVSGLPLTSNIITGTLSPACNISVYEFISI